MESRELTVQQPTACTSALIPTEHEFAVYSTMAKQAASSKFFASLGGEAGIATIMLYARELGIPPMQAITGGLHNIQGRIEMSARMINARIRQQGHALEIRTSTATECTIYGRRKDTGEEHSETYTIEMAARQGLVKDGSNWKKVPEDMLFARAISRLGRRLFPDVIGTAYAEGEIREAIEAEKAPKKGKPDNVIDGKFVDKTPENGNGQTNGPDEETHATAMRAIVLVDDLASYWKAHQLEMKALGADAYARLGTIKDECKWKLLPEMAPGPCPRDGDTYTVEVCSKCSERDGCSVYPAKE